jgi:hypothetical protein
MMRDSIRAAQDQLKEITSSLCQDFVDAWHSDLIKWRDYLRDVQGTSADTTEDAFKDLGLHPKVSRPAVDN